MNMGTQAQTPRASQISDNNELMKVQNKEWAQSEQKHNMNSHREMSQKITSTELYVFKEKMEDYKTNYQLLYDKMTEFIKNDKNSEVVYKSTIKSIKDEILDNISNDHGLIDYINELFAKLFVSYKSRLAYMMNIQNYIQI